MVGTGDALSIEKPGVIYSGQVYVFNFEFFLGFRLF